VKKANDFVIRKKAEKLPIVSQSTKAVGVKYTSSSNILSKMVVN